MTSGKAVLVMCVAAALGALPGCGGGSSAATTTTGGGGLSTGSGVTGGTAGGSGGGTTTIQGIATPSSVSVVTATNVN